MGKQIDVHVRLDADTYRRYCNFDAFRRRRKWFTPLMASMCLIAVSMFLLLRQDRAYTTAAGVLMGLGIAVPMVFFGLYFIQQQAQIVGQGLKGGQPIYSIRLAEEGIRVTNDRRSEPSVDMDWSGLYAAFRRRGCVYLYVSPERALILPDGQASVSDAALWSFILRHMGENRCNDMTG